MKAFKEWFRENSENSYARNMSRHEIAKQAFHAGMLAAADIVTDSARGFRLDREGVANKIREAAK